MKTDLRPFEAALERLLQAARPAPGTMLVLGGSTSAVLGVRFGQAGDLALAEAMLDVLYSRLARLSLVPAVQGCEHINRSLVLPRAAALRFGLQEVRVVPVPKAGGPLAAVHYRRLPDPAVVADLRGEARLGLDVGGVLVGMHLRPVVVPVPLGDLRLGAAAMSGGYSRRPLTGGRRTVYSPEEAEEALRAFTSRPEPL